VVYKKIKVRGSTLPEIDHAKVAEGLGAKIVNIPEISKEDSKQYQPLGSPVIVLQNNPSLIQYLGFKMLCAQGLSIDDTVGYRILDADEELQFRQDCGNQYSTVIQYYRKKD